MGSTRQSTRTREPTTHRHRDLPPRLSGILEHVDPDDRVLDLGAVQHDATAAANPNWLHGHLRERAGDVVGIDIAEDEVAQLREQGYDIRVGDVEDLDIDERVDVVVAGELIEHLSDLRGFFESVRRNLRPGGRLVLTTPNPWGFHFLKQALLSGSVHRNPTHTMWLDEEMLRLHCDRHGFEDVEVEYLKPPQPGITRLAWYLGRRNIGSANLLLTARKPPVE